MEKSDRKTHDVGAAVADRVTIGDRFREAREILRREKYRLPESRRRSRTNDFVSVLDAVADRHKHTK